ncbi:MAG: protein kinase, partial [Polyangiaceae bacterium]|nr:protein kinase [Polyangiaceae bacterium]
MPARHVAIGKPKHQGEKRGIDLVVRCLPDGYVVYSNVELSTGRRSGTTYEHDLLVLAPHAVFTVELKSWGGRLTGNRDRWQRESGAIVQSPIPLTLEKARVLKGVLETRARALRDVWVQGLVLLTEVDAQPVITPDFAHFVTTRRDIQRALTDPAAWGLTGNQLTKAQREDILRVFSDGEPATIPSTLGHFELLQRLTAEGRPYTAWLGKGPLGEQRVLHHYEIRGDSEKNRDRRRDLPLREATLHERLKGGPDLLDYCGYIPIEDPEGFVLTFEDTTPLLPAGTWVDKHNPGLEDRLRVARRVADALAWMHRRDVVHRRLSVDAILVSPAPSPAVVRLSALELSRDLAGLAPSVPSSLLEDPSYRCMAPELIRGGEATPASDLFSLGATLVELLSGRPLFERIEDALREFEIPPLHVGGQPVTVEVSLIIRDLLAPQPNERPVDAADVAERLGEVLRRAGRPAPRPDREILREGQRVLDVYELVKHLGEGASGSTWKARHTVDGSMVVLKIADAAQAPMLTNEADVLQQVHHANLVRYRDLRPFGGGSVLILACADGVDGRTWAGAGDALSLAQLLHLAGGLFGALGALHDAGWIHRDVKPENLVLRERDAQATLIDLGFARRAGEEGELTVGTVAYKDPLLWKQNGWTAGHDLFAAWLVIYEVLTGVHPFNARPESGRAPAIDPTLFPEAFEEAARRLAALFEAALSPDPGKRPATAADALARMRDALRASPPSAAPDRPRPAKSHNLPLPMPEPPRRIVLPDAVTPDTRIEQIDISSRAL